MVLFVPIFEIEEFKKQVEAEWRHLKNSPNTIDESELKRIAKFFTAMPYETLPIVSDHTPIYISVVYSYDNNN